MKSTTSLSIRQLACYWLLWLLVALLSLVLPHPPSISATGETTLHQATSLALVPEELLAPVVRRADVEGLCFPWRLECSRRRRTFRLPQWVVHLLQLWTLFRCMLDWNMAQWVDFLTGYQMCKFLGAMLVLYPLLEELEVTEIVNKYCPTEAQVEHGTNVVVCALNRLTAPRRLSRSLTGWPVQCCPWYWAFRPASSTTTA